DVKCLGFLYLYVGRYPRNNASRNTSLPNPTYPTCASEYRCDQVGLSAN
ncbi:MAG: hypothetical protein BECKG1743F_GA0114225_107326, partial [Candidatus Kentron sp. G]